MKKIQGKNLFTVESLNKNKPQLHPELINHIKELFENMEQDGIIYINTDTESDIFN